MRRDKYRIGHSISRLARMNARWLDARLGELGLSPAQLPVFGAIQMHGPLSQKELFHLLHVEQASMAQLLSRMEKAGLIARETHPNDARSSRILLTKQAEELVTPAYRVLDEGQKLLQNGLTKSEVATLQKLLTKLVHNMEEALQ